MSKLIFGEDARSFCAKLDKVLNSRNYKDTIAKYFEQVQKDLFREFPEATEEKTMWQLQGQGAVVRGFEDWVERVREAAKKDTHRQLAALRKSQGLDQQRTAEEYKKDRT